MRVRANRERRRLVMDAEERGMVHSGKKK